MASGSNSTSIAGQGISSTYQYSLSVSYSSGTQSIENNQTYIEARCTLSGQYIGWTGTNVTLQLYWHDNKNGDQLLNSGTWSSGGMGYGTREVFGSKWVKHQDNGTLDGCYAWVHVQASSGTYAPNSLQSLVTGGDRSFSTIPRTTSMSISATSRNLGESITITGSGASSSFTHKLYVLWNGSWIGINTSLGSSVNQSYTIPKSWANNLPNGTSGTATFSLDTYNGSTKIGNSQKSCTIYVPNTSEFNPSISSIAVSEANSSVATQFGFYVQNQSKLKFVNTCSGAYSSSINSIKTTINGTTYSGNTITTNAISASGTVSYTVTATDSRGRSVSKTGSVSVTAYSTPTLSGSAYRCNSSYTRDDNDGTYGQTTYSYNVVALSNKNTLTFTIDYRVSDGSWTNLKTISSGYSASNATFNMGNVLTATNTYEVRLGIKDFFSSTSYYVMTVSPTYTLINFGAGGKSIAFGQQSSNNGTMEINMPTEITTDGSVITHEGFSTKAWITGDGSTTYKDCQYGAYRSDTNVACGFGIGYGGTNHGIWSVPLNTWMIHSDGSKVYIKGNRVDSLFPVGAVYMTYNNNNPGNFLGGTWVQFGQGRTLIGQGTASDGTTSMTFNANATGGSYKNAISENNLSGNVTVSRQTTSYGSHAEWKNYTPSGWAVDALRDFSSYGQLVNNVQPYIVIYFWRRTA